MWGIYAVEVSETSEGCCRILFFFSLSFPSELVFAKRRPFVFRNHKGVCLINKNWDWFLRNRLFLYTFTIRRPLPDTKPENIGWVISVGWLFVCVGGESLRPGSQLRSQIQTSLFIVSEMRTNRLGEGRDGSPLTSCQKVYVILFV